MIIKFINNMDVPVPQEHTECMTNYVDLVQMEHNILNQAILASAFVKKTEYGHILLENVSAHLAPMKLTDYVLSVKNGNYLMLKLNTVNKYAIHKHKYSIHT
jgi:hypothetical protein